MFKRLEKKWVLFGNYNVCTTFLLLNFSTIKILSIIGKLFIPKSGLMIKIIFLRSTYNRCTPLRPFLPVNGEEASECQPHQPTCLAPINRAQALIQVLGQMTFPGKLHMPEKKSEPADNSAGSLRLFT